LSDFRYRVFALAICFCLNEAVNEQSSKDERDMRHSRNSFADNLACLAGQVRPRLPTYARIKLSSEVLLSAGQTGLRCGRAMAG
jgi:hypothetical protein